MRAGLKNAQYLAFTGTPLLGRERKTNAVVRRLRLGIQLPAVHGRRRNRAAVLQEARPAGADSERRSERGACRDSAKTRTSTTRSRRSWRTDSRRRSKSSNATTGWRRSPRTSSITSRDAATSAKGMVVSLDKFTAVKMYDKVQRLWKEEIKELRGEIKKSANEDREETTAEAAGLHAVRGDGRDRERGSRRGKEVRQAEARHQAAP